MAQIDFKNATVTIGDGYAYNGPTGFQLAASAMSGATTATLDTGVGILQVGDQFTVTGSTAVHTIASHTESMGNTTGITFTPALTGNVADNAVLAFEAHAVVITVGEGTLTYTEKRNMNYVKNRGILDTVREGDEEPMDVKFDFTWEFLKTGTAEAVTIEDALKKRGGAALWESSSADPCEPYAVKITILYTPPCSNAEDERIELIDFRWEQMDHDLKAGTVAVTGKCNVKEATVTRE